MTRERLWILGALMSALMGLIIASLIPTGGDRHRVEVALGHQMHGQLTLPFGLESSAVPTPTGVLEGGGLIGHFGGSRHGRRLGAGRGRAIYTGTNGYEPTMGIDSKGNIFYQGVTEGLVGPKVVVSRDRGRTWDDITSQTHPPLTFDPMLYVDPRTDRVFTADLTEVECTTVLFSDDVGQSWTTSKACGLSDHQNLFAGPPVSSPTSGYPNVVYLCAIDGGVAFWSAGTSCMKSIDGGVTWVRTGSPAYTNDPRQGEGTYGIPGFCDGTTGHGVVDSEGIVYLPRGWCGQPYLAISKDEGATWERIQIADNGMPRRQTDLTVWEHEAAVAVDAKGNIYYFWMARNRLPYLAVSTDGGKIFSQPMMVGPPGLKEAWGPKIDVGDVGKVALAYVGSTSAPGGKSPDGMGARYDYLVTWNGYISTSIDALSSKPRFFTASVNPPSDPIVRGECGIPVCSVQVDFIDAVIGPDGRPWTSMVDGCPPPGTDCNANSGFVGTVVGGPPLR